MTSWFNNLNNNFKGIILAIIGFSAFACADANAKYLTLAYKPEYIAGMTAVFGTAICVIFMPFLGGFKRTLQTKKLKFHLMRCALNPIIALLVLYAYSRLPLATAYPMIFMAPFFATILAIPLFKEKVSIHGWIAIIGGFIGVLIVVRPGAADLDPSLYIALAAAFFIGLLFLSARPLDDKETLASLAFYPFVTNLIIFAPLVLYYYGLPAQEDFFLFILQSALGVTGFICTAVAFRLAKTSLISPFCYGEILWGVGFDYYLFEEPPGPWTLIGGGVVIASGIYLIETERRSMKLEHG